MYWSKREQKIFSKVLRRNLFLSLIIIYGKVEELELSHHGNKKFLDFFDGSSELQSGTILGVFNSKQHMQLVRQVFPIWFASILFLLINKYTT